MKHNLLKSLIISVILLMGVSNAWAGITAVAVEKSSSTFFSYNKVKMNIDHKGTEDDEWETLDMTKLAITLEGKDLYIKEYSPKYGESLGALQFQLYNNSEWVDENMPISGGGWTTRPSDRFIWDYNKEDSKANWYSGLGFASNSNFYFDATDWSDISNIKLCIAHLSWHEYYELTNIPNTKLYYVKHPGGWGDAMGISVVGSTTDGGGQGIISEIPNSAQKYTGFRHWGFENAGNTAYFMVNKGDRGEMPDMYYYGDYNSFNHTQTIKTAIKNANGNYVVEDSKATISIKSYKITGNGVATEQNNSLTTSSNTATISAARTATTTLTVSEIEAGYKFDGWYDAVTGGNKLSSNPTYPYYPTSATTIYARFSEDNTLLVRGGEQFGDTWGSDVNVMTKKNELEQIVYYTVSITGRNLNESNTAYQFKIYNKTTDKWYGLAADNLHFWYMRDMGEKTLVEGNNGKNIELRADVPGEYVIKVDYSNETQPKITITYPEKHTVTLHPIRKSNGYSDYGYFIVAYGGITYTSSPTETITFDVASGSTITIVESQHKHPEIFNGDLCWKKSSEVNFDDWKNINNPINYPITVNDDIEITDNFVVRKEAVDKNITPNAGIHVFLRIRTNLMDEWIAKDKEETGSNIRPGYKGNEFANFIWLCDYRTPGHTIQGSTPEDRGCPKLSQNDDKEQPNGHFLMYDLNIDDANYKYYYCTITDSCWYHIKFERKHADSDPGNGGFFDVPAGDFPGNEKTCYSIDNYSDGKFIGSWVEAPKCKVTLGYTDIGRFGVEYNGEVTYEDKAKQEDGLRDDAVIEVPFGAEIKVLAGEPGNDAFVNSMLYIDETGKKTKLDFTEQTTSYTFKVRGDITVDDLFGTKQDYYIYIGIPKNEEGTIREEFKDWDLACQQHVPQGDQMYIWCHWPYDGFGLSGDEYYGSQALIRQIDVINTDEKYLFYKYELPKGIYTFNFQCKEYKDENNTSPEHAASISHYNPPLTTADCFILTGDKNDGKYAGYWTAMPSDGDFRILYVEQIVTKKEKVGDEWITEVKRTYEHSSDFIKPSELNTKGKKIVSLHIYTRGKNPEIILQKYDGTQKKWIDIEAHMVNGPLETDDPGMGLLPGRKNATPGSDIDDFVYDDGIEKIKNDPTDDGCGVWNFTVYKNGESAKLNLISDDGLKRYEGKYYIRTDNAEGQWINYKNPTNYMTFSPYAKQHHGEYFSHYFCKWVDTKQHYQDVSFIVANDYAQSLTDPSYLFEDQYVDNQWLPESANIRWGWSIINNKVSRAYIAGSYDGENDFLVVNHPKNDTKVKLQENINGEIGYFNDNTNWLYYADLEAQPEAQVKVRAKYNGDDQFFMGTSDQFQKLIGGDYENDKRYYPIRILYDFKEHRFVVGYHPEEQIVGKDVAIETPVMLIREHHNAPNQISFDNTTRTIEAPMPAYGVITFLEDKLKDPNISKNEKMFYWVSFPFDVRISHAFGLGEYGSHWVMEEYDGETRAEEGWNIYNTFWKYITDTATTLQAGKGYVLCLNYNKVINEAFLSDAAYEKISLYFPSIEEVDQSTIKKQDPKDITIPTWTGRAPTKDHNWNLIGAISYANTGETTQQSNAKFLYEYQPADDIYSPRASNGYTFNALHAYMVQYGGKITWNNFIAPQSIAAKRDTDSDNDIHALSLDLICNGTVQDQTFIQLEDGEATQMFDLNIDMTKIINSGSNIYSFSTDNNKLAGSVIPIEETIIPLGVVSAAAGEYTFAMPEGTDGIVVELIDYETNTRTNMLLDEYTVNLGKGTFDNRFALHVKPDKTTTSVDNIGNEATGDKVKKYLIDGVLYMQKDGVLYDAQGKLVR